MTITDITVEEFKAQILEICDNNPDNQNPHINGTCAYDKDGEHCLIGEWLVKHDLLTAPIVRDNMDASTVFDNLGFDGDVCYSAGVYQKFADTSEDDNGLNFATWGQVAEMIRSPE